jgi:CRP-like cAMP-binding protein
MYCADQPVDRQYLFYPMEVSSVKEIFSYVNLNDTDAQIVSAKLKEISVPKGKTILSAGQFVPYQYYVLSGCLRTYYLDSSGKEHTIQFAVNDWWISDYTAFFTGGRSILYIECIQNAVICQISKENMEILYKEVPLIETFFRVKMERFFASFQKRILSDLAMSAKDKYIRFLETYPQIEQTIKNYHLASYLGITTESLSRIRKELSHA